MNEKTIIFIVLGIIYYIYSNFKDKDTQKNRKTTSNPTPSQKSTLDDLLDKMLEQQTKRLENLKKPEPQTLVPQRPVAPALNKTMAQKKNTLRGKQGLPFEKRKLNDAREMPSRKQIEKVVIREKKATQQPVIKVKDYDVDFVDHDLPHAKHNLSENSKIKFSFKEEEQEQYQFDARQAIIAQVILERKF